MKISFDNSSEKLICIDIAYSDIKEVAVKEQFYKKVLFRLLNGKSINLVTIAPQDYSFGYEIIPHYLRSIDRKSYLVNTIAVCDFELIEKIVEAEEFTRTLLIIIKNESALSDDQLNDIISLIKNESVDTIQEVVYCEDDGNSLCIYNGNLTLTELTTMAESLELH